MTVIYGFCKELFDNNDLFDDKVRTYLGTIHGENVASWVQLLADALDQDRWGSYVDVYNEVERLELLAQHLGSRVADDDLVVWKGEPTILVVPMTSTSHHIRSLQ